MPSGPLNAGGNTRIGPTFLAQTGRARQDPGYKYLMEPRHDNSAEYHLQATDAQALVEATRNAIMDVIGTPRIDPEDAGGNTCSDFSPITATPWMAYNMAWNSVAALYMRDTSMLATVRELPDFLNATIPTHPCQERARCPPGILRHAFLKLSGVLRAQSGVRLAMWCLGNILWRAFRTRCRSMTSTVCP